jgi:hypothetical protein
MNWFILGSVIIVLLFSFVVLFGAPYLPVLGPQKTQALDMLGLKPGQTLLELGCGDGRVLRAAAQRGLKVVGYELNPILVVIAFLTTWKYRRQVRIIWGDYWRKDWPEMQGIFTFLLPKYMKKLDTKIMQSKHKPVKLVSFAFEIPGRKPDKQHNGLFLYKY